MNIIIYLSGVFFLIYGMSIFLIILIKNCSLSEARNILASFFKENTYSLSCDSNYLQEINKIVQDILGEERYQKLCILNEHSPTLYFEENSAGLACVNIVVSVIDDNERLQIETLIDAKTKFYLANYKLKEVITYLEWDKSVIFGFPLLKITYSQTDDEVDRIHALKNLEANNIIASTSDVIDDSEDLL